MVKQVTVVTETTVVTERTYQVDVPNSFDSEVDGTDRWWNTQRQSDELLEEDETSELEDVVTVNPAEEDA